MTIVAGALLAIAVLALATSGVALLVVRDGRDRIHYAGPATTLAPIAVVVALAAGGAGIAIVAKALLLVAIVSGSSAIVSHALLVARGARGVREGP